MSYERVCEYMFGSVDEPNANKLKRNEMNIQANSTHVYVRVDADCLGATAIFATSCNTLKTCVKSQYIRNINSVCLK